MSIFLMLVHAIHIVEAPNAAAVHGNSQKGQRWRLYVNTLCKNIFALAMSRTALLWLQSRIRGWVGGHLFIDVCRYTRIRPRCHTQRLIMAKSRSLASMDAEPPTWTANPSLACWCIHYLVLYCWSMTTSSLPFAPPRWDCMTAIQSISRSSETW